MDGQTGGSRTAAQTGSYVYTARPHQMEEEFLFRFLHQQSRRRVGMIHNGTGPARHVLARMNGLLPRLGMQLVHVVECQQGVADFQEYIREIANFKPDVLYLHTFADSTGLVLLQANSPSGPGAPPRLPVASADSALDPELLRSAGKAAEGLLISAPVAWDPSTRSDQRAFAARYQSRFGGGPMAEAALAYDAAHDLLPALIRHTQDQALPYTGESLKRALEATGLFRGGLTGDCAFTNDHQCLKDMAVVTVRGGQFTVLQVIRPTR